MILGQSAATAAVQAIREAVDVQAVDYATLRKQLLADRQTLRVDRSPRPWPCRSIRGRSRVWWSTTQGHPDRRVAHQLLDWSVCRRWLSARLPKARKRPGSKSAFPRLAVMKRFPTALRQSGDQRPGDDSGRHRPAHVDRQSPHGSARGQAASSPRRLHLPARPAAVVTISNQGADGHVVVDAVQFVGGR